jgi:hypothetical protein
MPTSQLPFELPIDVPCVDKKKIRGLERGFKVTFLMKNGADSICLALVLKDLDFVGLKGINLDELSPLATKKGIGECVGTYYGSHAAFCDMRAFETMFVKSGKVFINIGGLCATRMVAIFNNAWHGGGGFYKEARRRGGSPDRSVKESLSYRAGE